jgi:iron complex transport system ATP-binding protein
MRVTVDRVTWSPQGQPEVLRDVSLTAETGEVVGVIGPNGAGKSSLLRCIERRNKPQTGRVLLDGCDVWAMRARESAPRTAVVLQELPPDFHLTVHEIVQMGRIPYHGRWHGDSAEDIQITNATLTHGCIAR